MSKKNPVQKNNRRAKRGLKPKRSFFCLNATFTMNGDPSSDSIQKIVDWGGFQ